MPSRLSPSGRLIDGWPVRFAIGVNGIRSKIAAIHALALSMRSSS